MEGCNKSKPALKSPQTRKVDTGAPSICIQEPFGDHSTCCVYTHMYTHIYAICSCVYIACAHTYTMDSLGAKRMNKTKKQSTGVSVNPLRMCGSVGCGSSALRMLHPHAPQLPNSSRVRNVCDAKSAKRSKRRLPRIRLTSRESFRTVLRACYNRGY